MARDRLTLPIFLALGLHAGLAYALTRVERWERPAASAPVTVELREVVPPPPKAPTPPVEDPVAAEAPPQSAAEPPPPRPRPRAAAPAPEAPPPSPTPPSPDPAPAPAPAEPTFELPSTEVTPGGLAVKAGSGAPGALGGRPGGTGATHGGTGTTPGSASGTGSGGVASVASVKRLPRPIGDYDYANLGRDYPPQAKAAGIEGKVSVRILVDETGRVGEARIVKGLGYDLDPKALELVRRIRFEPAIDHEDRPVAVRITYGFDFKLPD